MDGHSYWKIDRPPSGTATTTTTASSADLIVLPARRIADPIAPNVGLTDLTDLIGQTGPTELNVPTADRETLERNLPTAARTRKVPDEKEKGSRTTAAKERHARPLHRAA